MRTVNCSLHKTGANEMEYLTKITWSDVAFYGVMALLALAVLALVEWQKGKP